MAVTQDHDPVSRLFDLLEPVADEENADAPGRRSADRGEQPAYFLPSQVGGRLVEDE